MSKKSIVRLLILAILTSFSIPLTLTSNAIAAGKTNFNTFCSYSFNLGTLNMGVQNAPGGTYAIYYELYISGNYQASYAGYNKPMFVPEGYVATGSGYQQGDVAIIAYPVSRKGTNNHLQKYLDVTVCNVYYSS